MHRSLIGILLIFLLNFYSLGQPTIDFKNSGVRHNNSIFNITGEFSEIVYGFESADIAISNGTLVSFDSIISASYNNQFNLDEISSPTFLATDGNLVFVVDDNDSINVLDKDGNLIRRFGGFGTDAGKFNNISGIDYHNDSLFVVDSGNARVQILDLDGNNLKNLNSGSFSNIVVDDNYLYLQGGSMTVHVLDKNGNFIRSYHTNSDSEWTERFHKICVHDGVVALLVSREHYFVWPFSRRYEIRLYRDNNRFKTIGFDWNPIAQSDFSIDRHGIFYIYIGSKFIIVDQNYSEISSGSITEITTGVVDIVNYQNQLILTESNSNFIHDINTRLQFSFDIEPILNTDVSISIPDAVALSYEGLANIESEMLNIVYDGIKPTVEINAVSTSPTDQIPLVYDIIFSEEPVDFSFTDIAISQPYLEAILTGSAQNYQLEVWPGANMDYTISIPDSTFIDLAGNYNLASNEVNINYQGQRPEVELIFEHEFSTDTIVSIDVIFTELVKGVTVNSFYVEKGTILNTLNSEDEMGSFNLQILPDSYEQQLKVFLYDSGAYNLDGDPIFPSNKLSLIHDVKRPKVSIKYLEEFTNKDTIQISVTFDERWIPDFTIDDFTVINAEPINITSTTLISSSNGIIYLTKYALIKTKSEGDLIIAILENAVHDVVGNGNFPDTLTIQVDRTRPLIMFQEKDTLYTQNIIEFDITTSESTDLQKNDMNVKGGIIQGMDKSGLNYNVRITPSITEGILTVSVPANRSFDLAGNGNLASKELDLQYDPTPQTVNITSDKGQYISDPGDEVKLTFTFSEPAFEFVTEDIELSGAVIKNLMKISDTTYELRIQPDPFIEGVIELLIPPNKVFNEAGVGNQYINYFLLVDKSNPKVEIRTLSGKSTIAGDEKIEIIFDDPVLNFEQDPIYCIAFDGTCFTQEDLKVKGGMIKNFKGNYDYYSFDLEPTAYLVEVTIPDNVAFNYTNLGNVSSNILTLDVQPDVLVVGNVDEQDQHMNYWVDSQKNLNINFNSSQVETKLSVIDLNGRIIFRSHINGMNWRRNVGHINSGIYILLIETSGEHVKSKFILN